MVRWRSRCQAGDDGDHDGALEMEIDGDHDGALEMEIKGTR